MPYPSRITRATIVETAREMIEAEGVDHLSLNKLSAALGVKTPSLYRYVKNRTGLLRAVNEATLAGLFQAIGSALESPGTTEDRLLAVARAYRQYVHAHPIAYGLAFTNTIAELRPQDETRMREVLRYQHLMAELAGEAESLAALRGLLALIHGFVMLELADQYRRGGDLNEAFEKSVRAYIAGWTVPPR